MTTTIKGGLEHYDVDRIATPQLVFPNRLLYMPYLNIETRAYWHGEDPKEKGQTDDHDRTGPLRTQPNYNPWSERSISSVSTLASPPKNPTFDLKTSNNALHLPKPTTIGQSMIWMDKSHLSSGKRSIGSMFGGHLKRSGNWKTLRSTIDPVARRSWYGVLSVQQCKHPWSFSTVE
ncbi:hypothetical protein O181_116251 [Austropuccinia psidii MF-1]|uniref:Uncharacterized protein n=1 Tax=Austropuccinia psidii MF-1 TaxID=1389203 RepID=A0A9Q3KAE3_9BASI|nr:hypothetical protein [Austropuccinia psidii MF-1]